MTPTKPAGKDITVRKWDRGESRGWWWRWTIQNAAFWSVVHAIYASVALHALTLSALRLKIHSTAPAFLSRPVHRRLHWAYLLGLLPWGSGSGLKFWKIREEKRNWTLVCYSEVDWWMNHWRLDEGGCLLFCISLSFFSLLSDAVSGFFIVVICGSNSMGMRVVKKGF